MRRMFAWLNRAEEVLLGWGLLGLAVFAFLQVVLRYAFASGFAWAEELGRYACILLTFLGASVGVRHGTHFSVQVMERLLPPPVARFTQAAASLISAALFALVAWYGWTHADKLHRFGVTSASLRIPMWVPYAAIPVFSATMAARFLVDGVLRALTGRGIAGTQGEG